MDTNSLVWRFPVWGPRIGRVIFFAYALYFLPMLVFALIALSPVWLFIWLGFRRGGGCFNATAQVDRVGFENYPKRCVAGQACLLASTSNKRLP